ncbi:MAG: outer membrane protein assembly factor BamD, partial [Planctomycetes bacterium]|nr:outer membrane protein assembly factor BamD [Planctomycetota bacterium]
AYRILDDISLNYPDERCAELAVKTKADHLFKEGEYDLAELEYARLLHDFPASRYCQYALRRSAEATLASFAGIDFDDAALIEAEERYRDYQASYRAAAESEGVSLILAEIRERQASKKFSVGRYYERTGYLSSAVFYYRSTVKDWPDTVAATKAKARLALLDVESVASRSTYPG